MRLRRERNASEGPLLSFTCFFAEIFLTYIYIHIYIYVCIAVYVCIYIYRERERHKQTHTHTHTYIYIYIYMFFSQRAPKPQTKARTPENPKPHFLASATSALNHDVGAILNSVFYLRAFVVFCRHMLVYQELKGPEQ